MSEKTDKTTLRGSKEYDWAFEKGSIFGRTSDKTALVILSEVVQSMRDIHFIAREGRALAEGMAVSLLPEAEIPGKNMTAAEVEAYEAALKDSDLSQKEAIKELVRGSLLIEETALNMMTHCTKFKPPL